MSETQTTDQDYCVNADFAPVMKIPTVGNGVQTLTLIDRKVEPSSFDASKNRLAWLFVVKGADPEGEGDADGVLKYFTSPTRGKKLEELFAALGVDFAGAKERGEQLKVDVREHFGSDVQAVILNKTSERGKLPQINSLLPKE